MSRWEQTLDQQTSLLEFWRSDRGRRYAEEFAEGQRKKHPENPEWQITMQLTHHEAQLLEAAAPVAVDPEVFGLVSHAAEALDEVIFHHEDLFAPYGFALLPEDVLSPDLNDKTISMRAFSWALTPVEHRHVETGEVVHESLDLHFTLYAHIDAEDDFPMVDSPAERAAAIRYFNGPLSMLHTTIAPMEEVLETAAADTFVRWMVAFFILASQQVIVSGTERAPKGMRKRARRAGIDAEGILVMTLRRTSASRTSDQYEVDWKQRWVVGGHWRKQWYPSLKRHKLRWITPYVKGPEDKPLVLHAGRAFEFKR